MSNFSAGMILGTAVGIAVCEAINPISKKDFKKGCCKANRMMKKMNKTIHNMM